MIQKKANPRVLIATLLGSGSGTVTYIQAAAGDISSCSGSGCKIVHCESRSHTRDLQRDTRSLDDLQRKRPLHAGNPLFVA